MINRQLGNFTMISNEVINNPLLSAKAKGIYMYLQSKKEDWQFYEKDIINHFLDGRDSIRSGIKELISLKLLLKYQTHDNKGFSLSTWILNPLPDDFLCVDGLSVDGKPVDAKPVDGKSPPNNTNNNNTKKSNTNSTLERVNFKTFKESYIKEFRNKEFFLKDCPPWSITTPFIINDTDLIINGLTNKPLKSSDSYNIWSYLYKRIANVT